MVIKLVELVPMVYHPSNLVFKLSQLIYPLIFPSNLSASPSFLVEHLGGGGSYWYGTAISQYMPQRPKLIFT